MPRESAEAPIISPFLHPSRRRCAINGLLGWAGRCVVDRPLLRDFGRGIGKRILDSRRGKNRSGSDADATRPRKPSPRCALKSFLQRRCIIVVRSERRQGRVERGYRAQTEFWTRVRRRPPLGRGCRGSARPDGLRRQFLRVVGT